MGRRLRLCYLHKKISRIRNNYAGSENTSTNYDRLLRFDLTRTVSFSFAPNFELPVPLILYKVLHQHSGSIMHF
eukprot:scaffold297727_cov17-Tisochrysis_lutea.AAC.1